MRKFELKYQFFPSKNSLSNLLNIPSNKGTPSNKWKICEISEQLE